MNFAQKLITLVLGVGLSFGTMSVSTIAQDNNPYYLFQPSISGSFLAGRDAFVDKRSEDAASFFLGALSEDWDNVVLLDRAFMSLVSSGRIEEAEELAQRLIVLEPENELARLVLGTVALKERRYSSAENQLKDMSINSLFGITSNVVLGWAQIGKGDVDKGYRSAEAITQPGFQSFLVFQRALMADVGGSKSKANTLYAEAYKADPYVFSIVEAYTRFLANNAEFARAKAVVLNYYKRGLAHVNIQELAQKIDAKQRPGRLTENVQEGAAELLRGLSTALSRDDASDVSIVLMRLAAYMNPKSDTITFSMAELMERASQFEIANEIYGTVGTKSNLYEQALVRIAENLISLDDVDGAIKKLSNIANQRANNLTAIIALGDALRRDKQYAASSDAYTKALSITQGQRPTDWHLYYVRGISYERQGKWPNAESDFKRALKIYPDQPQVLNYLGYTWVDMGDNLTEALGMIETAVSLRPNDGYIVDSLGWAYYKLGRYEDAVVSLERATRLTPSDPTISDHLGDAYWQVGRKREAGFQWNKARDMEPDEDLLLIIDEKIKSGLSGDQEVADAG